MARRVFDEVFGMLQPWSASPSAASGQTWQPPADIYRTSEGWLIKVELAGVAREEVEILASGQTLIIRGQRRDSTLIESLQHYSLEIAYSRFERRIEVPCNLDRAQMVAEYKDGMLLVRVIAAEGDS
ncbi:MAG: Hsp20/alpha crystallin family protein [Planctomycetes bacterium]|nr:Hsp20/alpha crystallin family protein [Planctomycetota bacterium]